MVTVKEYAKSRGVTIQAVHQQMGRKRNKEKLEGHVTVIEGVKWLDEEAEAILDESRKKTPIVIIDDQKDELIEELQISLKRKEDYIALLEASGITKQEQINKLEEKQLRIEQKRDEEIKTAEDRIKLKMETEFQEKMKKLQEQFESQLEERDQKHKEEIEAEKTRRLPLGEALKRIFS